MPKFMFVYRGPMDQHESDMSPEQMQQIMEAWNQWIGQGFEAGWMIDPGDALNPDGAVLNHDKVVSDGPFVEAKEIVGGFSIIQADDLQSASKLAEGCPAVANPGSTIEIRELAGLAPKE